MTSITAAAGNINVHAHTHTHTHTHTKTHTHTERCLREMERHNTENLIVSADWPNKEMRPGLDWI